MDTSISCGGPPQLNSTGANKAGVKGANLNIGTQYLVNGLAAMGRERTVRLNPLHVPKRPVCFRPLTVIPDRIDLPMAGPDLP